MHRGTKLQVVTVLTLLIATIGFAAPASAEQAPKVGVCHVDDEGNLKLINVSDNAYQAHIGHGDALPGGDVPGMRGYTYGDDCTAIPPPPAPTAVLCDNLGGVYSDDGNGLITCGPVFGLTLEQHSAVGWFDACFSIPGATGGSANWRSGDPNVSNFTCSYAS